MWKRACRSWFGCYHDGELAIRDSCKQAMLPEVCRGIICLRTSEMAATSKLGLFSDRSLLAQRSQKLLLKFQVSVVLIFVVILFSAASTSEIDILLQVKGSFAQQSAFAKWDPDLANSCTWPYITCNNDQSSVIYLELSNRNLSGSLSPAIGRLSNLQRLILSGNLISSSIPNEIGNLTQLQSLDLSHNIFTGPIPSTLENLSHLDTLLLDYNKLTGQIPSRLGNISRLNLSYNMLAGEVPNGIGQSSVLGNMELCGGIVKRQCPGGPPLPSSSKHKVLVSGLVAGSFILLIASMISIIWCRKCHVQKPIFYDVTAEDDPEATYGQLKKYTFRELEEATEYFSKKNFLGKGGFAMVYKGVLSDGSEVAVKRAQCNGTADVQATFRKEVEIIGLAVHRHILQLKGFCITPLEWLLVYPFMKNGSVASCLKETESGLSKLDWPKRKHIALGAARGLEYLHDHCNPKIIHRDIKAANILLDCDYEAVVGDFGLAKLVEPKNAEVSSKVRGTPGFMAPEYCVTGKPSEKTDVFSYGVLLLELITGLQAFELDRLHRSEEVRLVDLVKDLHYRKKTNLLVDNNLSQMYSFQEVEEMVQLALICTQSAPENRPRMAEIVRILDGKSFSDSLQEWKQMELVLQETNMKPQKLLSYDSDIEAVELSGAR